jgi:single-strand DNA-binding protein
MSSEFHGGGNLGGIPSLRQVPVSGGERRAVADMRVYFDRRVPKGDGQFEDEGGFWATVSIWGPRAETAARLLQKGARIHVRGTLFMHRWTPAEGGAERDELRVQADHISLDLGCLEAVTYRPPRRGSADAPGGAAASPAGGGDFEDEEIPY